jgi:hypothetical protein
VDRIAKEGWEPVCFAEFRESAECEAFLRELFPEQLNEEQQTIALEFIGRWGPTLMTEDDINRFSALPGGDFVEDFGECVQAIMKAEDRK